MLLLRNQNPQKHKKILKTIFMRKTIYIYLHIHVKKKKKWFYENKIFVISKKTGLFFPKKNG